MVGTFRCLVSSAKKMTSADRCVQATVQHALNFARSLFNGARLKFPSFSLFLVAVAENRRVRR